MIWDDDYIARITKEAEREIAKKNKYIHYRFTLAITSGTAVYTLPNYVREIEEITWQGKSLKPLYQAEASRWTTNYFTEGGEPKWYLRNPESMRGIRFIPIPNETLTASATDDTTLDTIISSKLVISCYREPDTSGSVVSIPDYVARRLIKAYVLSRAFAKEGKGQNLTAAEYYKRKYEFLENRFQHLRERFWNRNERLADIQDAAFLDDPVLPADFTIPAPILHISAGEMFDDMNNWADSVSVSVSP